MEKYSLKISDKEFKSIGASLNFSFDCNGNAEKDFEVTLQKFHYRKRVYEPCEIKATLTILPLRETVDGETTLYIPTNESVKKTFLKQPVVLVEWERNGEAKYGTIIAENYFVFKVRPVFSKSIITVELSIFSQDKLMTLDKHNTAYTARKLGKEILEKEKLLYTLDTSNTETDIKVTTDNGGDDNGDSTSTHTSVQGTMLTDVNLQFLVTKSIDGKSDDELRIPYAVQYDESFYDFLVRMANRYGEFLFFEEGKLHLGLCIKSGQGHTAHFKDDYANLAEEYYYESLLSEAITVEDRYYPYLERVDDKSQLYASGSTKLDYDAMNLEMTTGTTDNEDINKTLNEEKIGELDNNVSPNPSVTVIEKNDGTYDVKVTYYHEKGQKMLDGVMEKKDTKKTEFNEKWEEDYPYMYWVDGYPMTYYKMKDKVDEKDGNNVSTTAQTTDSDLKRTFYRNDPVAANEYLDTIEKDGYTSFIDEYTFNWQQTLFSSLVAILNSSTLYDVILNLGFNEAWHMSRAGNISIAKNALNNNTNIFPISSAGNNDRYDQNSGKVAQFSTLRDSETLKTTMSKISSTEIKKLTDLFYSAIRKSEKEVGEGAVWLNFGEKYQPLKLGDRIKVAGKQYIVIQIEGGCEQIGDDEEEKWDDQLRVMAIPVLQPDSDLPCPPPLPGVMCREAQPQQAFVAVNVDPKRIGRVRIRYPWQSADDDASPWLRVAQPMATNGGGASFKPEVGDEVMVGYEQGNIDRPFIIGYLQTPYVKDWWGALPDRGIRSRNGHALTFNDPVDGSSFFMNMLPVMPFFQKLIPTTAWLLKADDPQLLHLAGGVSLSDTYGLYRISASSDARVVTISSPLGNVVVNAFTGISISAPNGDVNIVGKNVKIVGNNKVDIISGANKQKNWFPILDMKDKSSPYTICSRIFTPFTDKVVSETIDKIIDIQFLRTVYETFLKPVDGTTKIKSYTFLQLEAGDGETQIPIDAYKHRNMTSKIFGALSIDGDLVKSFAILKTHATGEVDELFTKLHDMYVQIQAFKNFCEAENSLNKIDGGGELVSFDDIKDHAFGANGKSAYVFSFPDDDERFKLYPFPGQEPKRGKGMSDEEYNAAYTEWKVSKESFNKNNENKKNRLHMLSRVDNLRKALYEAFKQADKYKNSLLNAGINDNKFKDEMTRVLGYLYNANTGIKLDVAVEKLLSKNVTINETEDLDDVKKTKKQLTRRAAGLLLIALKNNVKFTNNYTFTPVALNNSDYLTDQNWHDFVDNLQPVEITGKMQFKKGWLEQLRKHLINPITGWRSFWRWNSEMKGKILFSDTPGRTVQFNSGELVQAQNPVSVEDRELRRMLKNI